ncbi:hypothetical protein C6A37_11405 [Desulfobacteraceae bacterium SEEP-SAG9]|nr:hypothetical protein C6A37_11405 [Desulfobacteraceae bacterium SEEP-SAG9]
MQSDSFNMFFADDRLHPDDGTGRKPADNALSARFEGTAGVNGDIFFLGKLHGMVDQKHSSTSKNNLQGNAKHCEVPKGIF